MTDTAPDYSLAALDAAAERVHAVLPPTPQQHWPLLSELVGAEVWVKHENHTPVGAFKVRGGINYVHQLKARDPNVAEVVAASTGNHGQSVIYAARRGGLKATIVVPEGNNPEKSASMRALGADLVEHGADFNVSFDHAKTLAGERRAHLFESYHPDLVRGVSSYALELFRGAPELDAVYVPIGMGSGCNGVVAARDALGLDTEVIGVVAEQAPAYLHSFRSGAPVQSNLCATFAEGLAVRIPHAEALQMILNGVSRVVAVSEDDLAESMRQLFSATHNIAEGAGASAFAALMNEREEMAGKRVAVVISGGNMDRARYLEVLAGGTPGRT
ncbi:MAG: threonine dehydratase [Pseudomonadota bacterium]